MQRNRPLYRAQHAEQLAEQRARQEAAERAAREFHAQPLPMSVDRPRQGQQQQGPSFTVPAPFALRSQELHEHEEWRRAQAALAEELRRREQARFHARPLPVVDEPFAPQASERPLTVPESPHLRSDARAAERGAYDSAQAEQRREAERRRATEEEQKARRDARELRAYRKSLCFKARPLPGYGDDHD